ncbi:MAG: hypothetical protein DYG89_27095 [Caldilinea sp. CFX5]|nr:hypothetical protein [Caldilinea sp. CFX5]
MTNVQFNPHLSFYFTLPHLQITFAVDEYRSLLRRHKDMPIFAWEQEYWAHLPEYVVARCPICHASYTAKLDTHQLETMTGHHTKTESIYRSKHQNTGCKHFVGVTTYANLNGLLPTEYSLWSNWMGDVPVITPTFLPDDVKSYAVLHCLPACRLKGDTFSPCYSIYILTYYAEDPGVLWARRKAEMTAIVQASPGVDLFGHIAILYTSDTLRTHPHLGQLHEWVASGKLCWLDLHSRHLPLRHGPVEDFPYHKIQGYERSFTYYRNGWLPWHRWLHKDGLVCIG